MVYFFYVGYVWSGQRDDIAGAHSASQAHIQIMLDVIYSQTCSWPSNVSLLPICVCSRLRPQIYAGIFKNEEPLLPIPQKIFEFQLPKGIP